MSDIATRELIRFSTNNTGSLKIFKSKKETDEQS